MGQCCLHLQLGWQHWSGAGGDFPGTLQDTRVAGGPFGPHCAGQWWQPRMRPHHRRLLVPMDLAWWAGSIRARLWGFGQEPLGGSSPSWTEGSEGGTQKEQVGRYHRSPTGRRPRTAPLSWRRGPGQLYPHSNLAPGVRMSKPGLALEQRRGSWIGDPWVGAPGGVEVGYNKASLAEPQVPGCGTPPPPPRGGGAGGQGGMFRSTAWTRSLGI